MMRAIIFTFAAMLTMGAVMPADAFDFEDWAKSEDANGVLTFDCAKFQKCGPGSRITVASAPAGPAVTVEEYRALHRQKVEQQEELKGKVTLDEPRARKVRGFDVVEIGRTVRLSDHLTHHAINAIIHKDGKRHQIICSAEKETMARANFEGVLNETISYVSR